MKTDPRRATDLQVAEKALALHVERMGRFKDRVVAIARLMALADPWDPTEFTGHGSSQVLAKLNKLTSTMGEN